MKRIHVACMAVCAVVLLIPRASTPADDSSGVEMKFDFTAKNYRGNKFPGWCVSYMTFRNEKKRRPLYVYGWGNEGIFSVIFDNDGGLRTEYATLTKGKGSVNMDRYSCTSALDWDDFACGAWVKEDPHPKIVMTVKAMRGWKKQNNEIKKFLDANRGILPKKEMEAMRPKYEVSLDLDMTVNEKTVSLKGVPCSVTLGEGGTTWSMYFQTRFKFKGVELGLTGDDAGEIAVSWCSGAFAKISQQFKAPGVKKGAAIDDTVDDLFDDL